MEAMTGQRLVGEERGRQKKATAARHIDDASLVRLDLGLEDTTGGVKRFDGASLIRRHQARVARSVRSQNRREPLPDAGVAQHPSRNRILAPEQKKARAVSRKPEVIEVATQPMLKELRKRWSTFLENYTHTSLSFNFLLATNFVVLHMLPE